MSAAKVLVTLVIVFVGINLLSIIYNSIKRKVRQGFENKNQSCPKGCRKFKNIDDNCGERVHSNEDGTHHYRKCDYKCPNPYDKQYDVDQMCDNNQECKGCGTFEIITDANGYKLQRDKNPNGPVASNAESSDAISPYRRFDSDGSTQYSGSYEPPISDGIPVNGREPANPNDTRDENADNDRKYSDTSNRWGSDRKYSDTDNRWGSDREYSDRKHLDRKHSDTANRWYSDRKHSDRKHSDTDNRWDSDRTDRDDADEYVKSTNADDHCVNKKRAPLYDKSKYIHSYGTPHSYTNTRTTNMMSYIPKTRDLERKEGYAFEGGTIGLDSEYSELSVATNKCHNTVMCAGVNFDIVGGNYYLMPHGAKLVRRRGYVAYIKTGGALQKPYTAPSGAFRHRSANGNAAGSGTGAGESWTIVANITPAFDTNECHQNNTCPNGSLTSTSSSNARNDGHYSNDSSRSYQFNTEETDYRKRHHRDQYKRHYNENSDGRGKDYEDYRRNNKRSAAEDYDTKKSQSLLSGKPPDTPYTKFAPTNKPRNPNIEPRPYNSLMDLFR